MPEPGMTNESRAFLSSLTDQRDHVLGILEGLSDADLRRPVLPSGWTCLGLVRHLAIDVERFWFRSIMAGQEVEPRESDAAVWQVSPDEPAEDVLGLYRREIDLANAVIAVTPLDTPPARWPDDWPDWHLRNLRETLLQVITETACHAGHLDAVRELIDGRTWLVLTE
jgi:Protein of unknown function (DUF664)